MLKRCISYDEKFVLRCNLLVYSRLHKTLISQEFAPDVTKSQRANTRLFLGVEQKTQTEKAQDTENL